ESNSRIHASATASDPGRRQGDACARAATIFVTLIAAVLGRDDRIRLGLLVSAVVCFVVAGMTTRFLNQPINRVVIQWTAEAPPVEWMGLRDEWWRWHLLGL